MKLNLEALSCDGKRALEIQSKLNVLIACEESQAECVAFRALGHNAFSCDVKPCSLNPDWHILGDVTPYLHGTTGFVTQSGKFILLDRGWDLIIAHPPCTYLCRVSAVRMVQQGKIDWARYKNMIIARRFFLECLNADAPFVAVENPIPMARAKLPEPDAYVCPSWFGVKYTKKTLYWLKNLPPIMAKIEFPNPKCFVTYSRGKYRSRTFPQLAQAIARQWSDFILKEKNELL